MNTELEVRIESEGGVLSLTPLGLLEHFLPGATLMPGSTRIFEGHKPGQPNAKVYVQAEAVAAMLMEMKEKHIGLSGIYLIPSKAPDKPAGHKIKYDVGIQRARRVPGFLGMNMGLIVERNKERVETFGEEIWSGDIIRGGWAELYARDLPRPLKHCISTWTIPSEHSKVTEEFIVCKTAVDHLLRLHYPTLYNAEEHGETGVLEAVPAPESAPDKPETSLGQAPTVTDSPGQGEPFKAGQIYIGTLTRLQPRRKRPGSTDSAGVIELETEHGPLMCYFFSRPDALKKEELDWETLSGQPAAMSFTEKPDRTGQVWRHVRDFKLASDAALTEEQPEPAEEGV